MLQPAKLHDMAPDDGSWLAGWVAGLPLAQRQGPTPSQSVDTGSVQLTSSFTASDSIGSSELTAVVLGQEVLNWQSESFEPP